MENWNESKKALKTELKKKFPEVKFSLTKSNYDTLRIKFTDSIYTLTDVQTFVRKFEGKDFDGMQDLESYVDTGLAFGYIFVEWERTEDFNKNIYDTKIKNKNFGGFDFNMEYADFLKLDFYSSAFPKGFTDMYGLNPENMIYRNCFNND